MANSCRLIHPSAGPFSHGAAADETLKFLSLITGIFVFNPGKPHCHIAPEALWIFEFVRIGKVMNLYIATDGLCL